MSIGGARPPELDRVTQYCYPLELHHNVLILSLAGHALLKQMSCLMTSSDSAEFFVL